MSLKQRFDSLLMQVALAPNVPAAALGEHTTGGEHDHAPRGAFQKQDVDRVEELITDALRASESLSGLFWDGTTHVAKKHKKYDEREWTIHILANYQGRRNRLVAAEENVPYYVIRDARKKYGYDGYGAPIPDFTADSPSVASIRAAVEEIVNG